MCRQRQSGWRQLAAYRTEGQTSASRKDNILNRPRPDKRCGCRRPDGRMSILSGCRGDTRPAASKRRLLGLSFRDLVQTTNNVAQQKFVLKVELVIKIRPQPVFMCLPILRHHDDWGLQPAEYPEHEI